MSLQLYWGISNGLFLQENKMNEKLSKYVQENAASIADYVPGENYSANCWQAYVPAGVDAAWEELSDESKAVVFLVAEAAKVIATGQTEIDYQYLTTAIILKYQKFKVSSPEGTQCLDASPEADKTSTPSRLGF